jgi:hypothetical protein
LPAIERYDGPAFRVLRKFLREQQGPMPRILILSGKFGLIEADKRIQDYDLRMTPSIAKLLQSTVLRRLRKVIEACAIQTVGLCVGKDYRQAVEGIEGELPDGAWIEVIGGGLGRRLKKLREWLYCGHPIKNGANDGLYRRRSRANDAAKPRAGQK